MKTKHLLLALLAITSCLCVNAQQKFKPLHKIVFFKMVNNGNEIAEKFVLIDADGKVYDRDDKLVASFESKQLTEAVNKYVSKEYLDKYPANNEPPLPAILPESNQQSIHISVWFQDDVDREADFGNKTHYHWFWAAEKGRTDYPIYKYLAANEAAILKRLLK